MTTPPCAADPETWFPNPQDQETTDYAVATCRSCPLVEPCLELAMRAEGTYGTWARYGIYGGLTPGHRATLARHRARRRRAREDMRAAFGNFDPKTGEIFGDG